MIILKTLQLLLLLHHLTSVSSLTTCPRQCICHEHSIACSCETSDKPELIISSLGSTYITSLVVHTCDKVTVLNGSFSGVVLVERLSFIAIGRLYFEPHAFKDILQSPRQLVIDECKIPSLAPVAFAGLSHIDHLWFRNSEIEVIAMEAFHYLTNIDYIYFHRTKIGRIERRGFSKMYQVDHLYFKESIDIEMIESEAFSDSQISEIIMDGVNVQLAHDTFLLNINADSLILKNSSFHLNPRSQDSPIEISEEQKMIEKCLIDTSNINTLSPYKLGCTVLEVTSSTIKRIGPVSRDIDTPVYRPEPSISSNLNSVAFSNCSIGSVDSFAFVNYTLSILSFQHSIIDSFKQKSVEKSKIAKLELLGSTVNTFENSAFDKSKISNFDIKSMEIQQIGTDFISNSSVGTLRILSSKIEKIEKNIFKNTKFERCEVDGNRVMVMDSEAFYGDNQISSLSITANDLSTSPSPSFLSPSSPSLPTNFLLANNTIDCSPTDCSTNSFLLNSPKHSPLLYQISSNRCRPPLPNNQNPCVEPRISSSLDDSGITCRISHLIADCVCVSSFSRLPAQIDQNVSIVILGDCENLEIDVGQGTVLHSRISQIYIFRTTNLVIRALPPSLKVLKVFHSTVSLLRGETHRPSLSQNWEFSHSKISKISPSGLSNLRLTSLSLQDSRISQIPPKSTVNSSISNLIIERCHLESTEPLFAISASLRMAHSLVFSSPRGLGAISSAQLQNNTLLECCRHPYLDYRSPMGLDTIDLDPRCDVHFYGTRCFSLDVGGPMETNHLPITSSFASISDNAFLRFIFVLFLLVFYCKF